MPLPRLKVVGNKLKDPAGNNVILRGVAAINVRDAAQNYGINYYVDLAVDTWHSKIMRLYVHPAEFLADPNGYFNNYIDPFVQRLTTKNCYAIIDWHYIADPRNLTSQTDQFWTFMAPKYKDYTNVFYELFNENSANGENGGTMTWAVNKGLMERWITIIRNANAPNIIITGAGAYSQHIRDWATSPISDKPMPNGAATDGLAVAFHKYPDCWDRYGNIDADGELRQVAAIKPIFMTEWGWDDQMPGTEVNPNPTKLQRYKDNIRRIIEETGVNYTSWDFEKYRGSYCYPQLMNADGSPRSQTHGVLTKQMLYDKRNSDQPSSGGTTPPPLTSTAVRVNCGGSAYTTADGRVFKADTPQP